MVPHRLCLYCHMDSVQLLQVQNHSAQEQNLAPHASSHVKVTMMCSIGHK